MYSVHELAEVASRVTSRARHARPSLRRHLTPVAQPDRFPNRRHVPSAWRLCIRAVSVQCSSGRQMIADRLPINGANSSAPINSTSCCISKTRVYSSRSRTFESLIVMYCVGFTTRVVRRDPMSFEIDSFSRLGKTKSSGTDCDRLQPAASVWPSSSGSRRGGETRAARVGEHRPRAPNERQAKGEAAVIS